MVYLHKKTFSIILSLTMIIPLSFGVSSYAQTYKGTAFTVLSIFAYLCLVTGVVLSIIKESTLGLGLSLLSLPIITIFGKYGYDQSLLITVSLFLIAVVFMLGDSLNRAKKLISLFSCIIITVTCFVAFLMSVTEETSYSFSNYGFALFIMFQYIGVLVYTCMSFLDIREE